MSLYVDIEKRLGVFRLQSKFEVADETLALLGASGCGKSVTALSVLGLVPPAGRVAAGEIRFGETDLRTLGEGALRKLRGNRIAMIFQDPMTSLNPVYPVGRQVAEGLRRHRRLDRWAAKARTVELFQQVGIPDPAARYDAYPRQLSGGLRQRVMIRLCSRRSGFVTYPELGSELYRMNRANQERIRAAVEEAENMGSYVSTHAQATRGIKMALKNGVKCIEHGFYLDEECIELMVKNDCYLVPTLAIMHASKLYFQGKEGVLPYLKEKTEKSYEAHYRSLEMARKAHITVGVGCDFLGDAAFGCPYSEATLELERLCVAGYTPMEVITMATKVNARLLQMEDQLGTLETGKLADVLLVEGRPDEDIRVLRRSDHVKLVIQDGRIVKNAMPHTAKA